MLFLRRKIPIKLISLLPIDMTKTFEDFASKTLNNLPSFEVVDYNEGTTPKASTKADILVVLTNKDEFKEHLDFVSKNISNLVDNALAASNFKGECGDSISIFPANLNGGEFARLVILSIGCYKDFASVEKKYEIGSKIAGIANSTKQKSVAVLNLGSKDCATGCMSSIYYGACLANYAFTHYYFKKLESKQNTFNQISFFVAKELNDRLSLKLKSKQELAKANYLVRQLVDTPSSDLYPEYYAEIVKSCFEGNPDVKVKIIGEGEMTQLGMHSLLAVNKGSSNEAKTVIIEYMGNKDSQDIELALVGKGVCFDSGGLSIKPATSMEDMKIDMGGSAACFGSLFLLAKQKVKANVVAALGLVENLVSANSFRPGDVLKSMSGQTIEVLNTDAEGRLVLADVLYYTQKNYKPKTMIDFATLTGAVTVALADVYAAIMTPEDDLSEELIKAGSNTNDKLWRLPLGSKYDSMIDSGIADMKNIGSGRGGGTITAGQFLARFVNCDKDAPLTKWAHIDIAGVAYDGKYGGRTAVKGATGFGVELILEFVKSKIESR
jgi:leucyl aminopeptidase